MFKRPSLIPFPYPALPPLPPSPPLSPSSPALLPQPLPLPERAPSVYLQAAVIVATMCSIFDNIFFHHLSLSPEADATCGVLK